MASIIDPQQNVSLPSYRNAAHKSMSPYWPTVRDLCGGAPRLQELGTLYLPKEPNEGVDEYAIRLRRTVLANFFERALAALVGMVFRSEPELEDDVPEVMRGVEATDTEPEIDGQLEDCDLAGSHWTVFAKELFTDAMRDGHAFLMTDMPPSLSPIATLADERAAGRRPYWVKYTADQAINWRTDRTGKLEQITFRECTLEADGEFGEAEVVRYRVLRPGSWQLWREIKSGNGELTVIPDPDSPGGTTSLSDVPVSVVYGRKTGVLISKPPLLDLAVLNLAHYNKYSDLSIYLHIASRPILWFAGRDKSKKVETIGKYTFFDVPPEGKVAFAETTGAALGAARIDLLDLQDWMATTAISILAKKTSTNSTATEERGDQVREESDLATAARSLKDCLETGLTFWARYLDPAAINGGSIKLGVLGSELTIDAQTMTAFANMAGDVFSKQTVREVIANGRADLMPEDYTEEEEAARLDRERAMVDRQTPAGLDSTNLSQQILASN